MATGVTFGIFCGTSQRLKTPDSWLVLPFDEASHVWRFNGALLVKMDKNGAQQDPDAVKSRVETLRGLWGSQVYATAKSECVTD